MIGHKFTISVTMDVSPFAWCIARAVLKYLKAKCLKSLNILKVLSHTTWGADRTTLLQLYRSLIRSKLDYGSIVYGSARKSYLAMIDPIHHQGLRLALGAFRTSPTASLYVEADEPSLNTRREKLSLQYAIRIAGNDSNPAHPRSDSTTLPWSLGHTSHLGTILIVILVPVRECKE